MRKQNGKVGNKDKNDAPLPIRWIGKYIEFIERFDPRKDDEVFVERYERFEDILPPSEKILWRGAPLEKYSWSDHDLLESPGSVGERPLTMKGRVVESVLGTAFVLFLFFAGIGSFYSGVSEISGSPGWSSFAGGVFLVLLGITLMTVVLQLFRPYLNKRRARKISYLLTTSRALVIRRGPPWAEIFGRTPLILFVSLLMLYSLFMFASFFLVGSYEDWVNNAPMGTWAARAFIVIVMLPFGFMLAVIGFIGFRFQMEIIIESFLQRKLWFVRNFKYMEIVREDFPVISRKRRDGAGDVILGQDGHWEYYGDSSIEPQFKINAVGFLSVPDAEKVVEQVDRAIATSRRHDRAQWSLDNEGI